MINERDVPIYDYEDLELELEGVRAELSELRKVTEKSAARMRAWAEEKQDWAPYEEHSVILHRELHAVADALVRASSSLVLGEICKVCNGQKPPYDYDRGLPFCNQGEHWINQ